MDFAPKRRLIRLARTLLPQRLRVALFHLGFNIAQPEFEKFAFLYSYAPNMRLGLEALRDRGFRPFRIIDIGAFHGSWSLIAKAIWPSAQIAMIEPNRNSLLDSVAAKLDCEVYYELLGAEHGRTVDFHVMGSGSSVFEEWSSVPRKTEHRRLATLDSVLRHWASVDLLKIDAQGCELEILKGARLLLPKTTSALLEVSLIQTNAGAPLFDEVIRYMKGAGFVAHEILQIHRRPLDRAMNQVDILFVREASPLLSDRRHWVANGDH